MSEEATLDEFVQEQENDEQRWKTVQLSDIASKRSDNVDPQEVDLERHVGLEHIDPNNPVPDWESLDSLSSTKRRFSSGDILFAKLRPNLEKSAQPNFDGVASTDIFPIVAESSINSKWLLYRLSSKSAYDYARRTSAGTRMPRTSWNLFSNFEFDLPTLPEQRKIATVLYTVDQAIERTAEIIEQIERAGQGLRQKLFSEGYYDHETESYGTLGEVPSDWEKTRLYKIAKVARGKFTHRPRNDPDFYDGDYPFIQTGEVVDSVGELTEYSQTLNEKGKNVSKEFSPGTIIITIAGNIGDTAVATFPVYFPDSLVGITPNEDVDEYFLEHYLRYRQDFLNRLSTKTTQKNLNLTLLRPIEVIKPPIDEQKEIAEALTSVDERIKRERQYKTQLQRIKRGLIQDLLSGIVRTTNTTIDIPEGIAKYG
ncbi:restriction endonuclease subunit S [Halorubrum sp. FL23]|uniref:restriction endonuclease subunit S n=1 Tax=Halorubrum sp. FL23 TaxID=3458704 RepID=UPI0040336AC0